MVGLDQIAPNGLEWKSGGRVVLFAGDQDFVPLIRKVNGIGTRVMLIAVDAEYKDALGKTKVIRTSQALIEEASYLIVINQEIDSRTAKGDRIIDGIFQA